MNIRLFADHCVSNYVIQELHNAGKKGLLTEMSPADLARILNPTRVSVAI